MHPESNRHMRGQTTHVRQTHAMLRSCGRSGAIAASDRGITYWYLSVTPTNESPHLWPPGDGHACCEMKSHLLLPRSRSVRAVADSTATRSRRRSNVWKPVWSHMPLTSPVQPFPSYGNPGPIVNPFALQHVLQLLQTVPSQLQSLQQQQYYQQQQLQQVQQILQVIPAQLWQIHQLIQFVYRSRSNRRRSSSSHLVNRLERLDSRPRRSRRRSLARNQAM